MVHNEHWHGDNGIPSSSAGTPTEGRISYKQVLAWYCSIQPGFVNHLLSAHASQPSLPFNHVFLQHQPMTTGHQPGIHMLSIWQQPLYHQPLTAYELHHVPNIDALSDHQKKQHIFAPNTLNISERIKKRPQTLILVYIWLWLWPIAHSHLLSFLAYLCEQPPIGWENTHYGNPFLSQ